MEKTWDLYITTRIYVWNYLMTSDGIVTNPHLSAKSKCNLGMYYVYKCLEKTTYFTHVRLNLQYASAAWVGPTHQKQNINALEKKPTSFTWHAI